MLTMEKTLQNNVHLATRESWKINQETDPHPLPYAGLPWRQRQPFITNRANEAESLGLRRKSQVSPNPVSLLVIVARLSDLIKILRQHSTRSVLINHEVPQFQCCRAK